jgi:hypothetical protein
MRETKIEVLALSESRWPGQGMTKIDSCTIFHSGSASSHVHGVGIVLSQRAYGSWEAAGSHFVAVSERIISIWVKVHFAIATIFTVYAPTNPSGS